MLLSAALEFPQSFFLQTDRRISFGSSAAYYRKRAKVSATDRKFITGLVNILRISIKTLLNSVDLSAARKLPPMRLEEHGNSPTAAARALRAFWQLPDGPIPNLTSLIESAGVIVIPCDFQSRDMDATSLWPTDSAPLIFMNSEISGDRWRFTLCHELAHLLLHDVPRESMEDEADEFAAEFLAPTEELKAQLLHARPLRIRKLLELKEYWKISIASLLVRADQLGIIDERTARALWMERSQLGGDREPGYFPSEPTKNLANILKYHLQALEFTASELARCLSITSKELRTLLGVTDDEPVARPKAVLRLV